MNISGSFVLAIIDSKLDFKDIENNLYIKPTKIVKKGKMVSKMKNIAASYDIWSYEIPIVDSENAFNSLSLLLDDVLPYSAYIKIAASKYESVVINCYIRSDYGQIGFQLSNEVIMKLERIGLSLDFHILSFGAVEG